MCLPAGTADTVSETTCSRPAQNWGDPTLDCTEWQGRSAVGPARVTEPATQAATHKSDPGERTLCDLIT